MGYSTLLFLHVTSAFTMVTAAGLFLAIALAQRSDRHSTTDGSIDAAIAAADQSLYRAKRRAA